MKSPKDHSHVFVTCTCGAQQRIPLSAIYDPILCANCSERSEIASDQIAQIVAAYAQGLPEAMAKLARGDRSARVEVDLPRSARRSED